MHVGNNLRMLEKKGKKGVFNLYQYWYFRIWSCQFGLKHSACFKPMWKPSLWASDAVWTPRFLTCHKAICRAGCLESAGTGRVWMPAFEESPHWVALEPGVWECGLARTCVSASCRAALRLPKFGLTIILSNRMETTGKCVLGQNLTI